MTDLNTRFLLTQRHIRGQIIQLESVAQAACSTADYPADVAHILSQALAATAALASTIKLEGAIILQLQGDGSMPLLVAQASNNGALRGLAKVDHPLPLPTDFKTLVGQGRIVITIDGEGSQRYQGIVEIDGTDLALCLDQYFERSEQLATRLYLTAEGAGDQIRASAILLQQLPSDAPDEKTTSDWQHITTLANTLTKDEQLHLPASEIIHRLFHEEDVRLFDAQPLCFHCSCSRQKVATAIKGMGREEAEKLIQEQGEIQADCGFCNQKYRFDCIDIAATFDAGITESQQIH